MSDPYIGEIRMFGGNFAPVGWMFCNGQLLAISQYEALFSLVGTTYGGDGQTTFALPDLRGRIPLHNGNGIVQGETLGTEDVTLMVSQLPMHTHPALVSNNSGSTTPVGNVPSVWSTDAYLPTLSAGATPANVVSNAGGSQPHTNMQPFLCVSFIIATEGIFPSQG